MQILKGIEYTFTASFGASRTGKNVAISIFDSGGDEIIDGFTFDAVFELGGGVYGVAITFTDIFAGFIKWLDTDDNLQLFDPFVVVDNFVMDITSIKKVELNRWKIANNKLTIYDDDNVTALYVFDLKKQGVANGLEPDERLPE